MPRGGRHEADGWSPYKRPDGVVLQLAKSSKSKNGYLNVVEPHTGQFYPKKKLDGESGSKKMKTFGTKCGTAREAAIKLAEYLFEPYPLPEAGPRAAYGSKNMEKYLFDKLP